MDGVTLFSSKPKAKKRKLATAAVAVDDATAHANAEEKRLAAAQAELEPETYGGAGEEHARCYSLCQYVPSIIEDVVMIIRSRTMCTQFPSGGGGSGGGGSLASLLFPLALPCASTRSRASLDTAYHAAMIACFFTVRV